MFKERVQCLREAGEVLCEVSLQKQSRDEQTLNKAGIRRQFRKLRG